MENLDEDLKEKLQDFVRCGRQLARDVMDKKITADECWLIVWLRLIADIYGKTYTSYVAVRDDAFQGKSISYVNKLFLTIRKKGYVYFPEHRGHRGSFKIENDLIRLPNGTIKRIQKLSHKNQEATEAEVIAPTEEEPNQTNPGVYQNSESEEPPLITKDLQSVQQDAGRGRNKRKYKHKHNHTDTNAFLPKDKKQKRLKEIAIALNEPIINPILALEKKYGLPLMEKALTTVQNSQRWRKNSTIENPGAYFTTVVDCLYTQSVPPSNELINDWVELLAETSESPSDKDSPAEGGDV